MGESVDYADFDPSSGVQLYDYGQDTAPAGGGDPYADAPPDANTPETFDGGFAPGGGDGQLTPFSPGGGFDFTNALAGRAKQAWWGAGAVGSGPFPGAGMQPQRAPMVQDFGNMGVTPLGRPPGPNGPSPSQVVGSVVRNIRGRTGMRVSAKSLVNLITRYGFQGAGQLTGASPAELLMVFMQAKGVRHHRRGPGLYTIAKKLRAAGRLQATVRRLLGPAVRSHSSPAHHARRRKGR